MTKDEKTNGLVFELSGRRSTNPRERLYGKEKQNEQGSHRHGLSQQQKASVIQKGESHEQEHHRS